MIDRERSKFKNKYTIKLSDEENDILIESAHDQNMKAKTYIITLIVNDCLKKMIERSHLITLKTKNNVPTLHNTKA